MNIILNKKEIQINSGKQTIKVCISMLMYVFNSWIHRLWSDLPMGHADADWVPRKPFETTAVRSQRRQHTQLLKDTPYRLVLKISPGITPLTWNNVRLLYPSIMFFYGSVCYYGFTISVDANLQSRISIQRIAIKINNFFEKATLAA